MKNNFSNFIKIICIIIVIVLLIWVVFYIVTKNDNQSSSTNNRPIEPDENISVIEKELTTIFSYINGVRNSTSTACTTLKKDLGFNIQSSDNFFDYYAPVIIECLYDKNYPTIYYTDKSEYKIINENEINEYNNYFNNLNELNKISTIYSPEYLNTISEEIRQEISNYINGTYYLAYMVSSTAPNSSVVYKLERIFKEQDYYNAVILAQFNNQEYIGNLQIEMIDGHPKYSTLHFY